MKAFLNKLIHGLTALMMLFAGHSKEKGLQGRIIAGQLPKLPKKELSVVIKGSEEVRYPGRRRDLRLLHKKLALYQRSVWKGDFLQKEEAFKRLQKQWRKVQRNEARSLKVIHKDTSLSA